jgi:predicted transposase YbfD/YdcC
VRADGKGHELAAAKALLAQVPLAGRIVTADALLTQRAVSEQIVADQGDFLLPIDENQPALLADAEAALSPLDAGRPPAGRRADRGDAAAQLAPA